MQLGRLSGITPPVEQTDRVAEGVIRKIDKDEKTRSPVRVVIKSSNGEEVTFEATSALGLVPTDSEDAFWEGLYSQLVESIEFDDNAFEIGGIKEGDRVIVSSHQIMEHVAEVGPDGTVVQKLRPVTHFKIREASRPLTPVFNNEGLPLFLFLGAALMTLLILVLLVRKLPDFFVRTLAWARALGRYRIKVVGMHNLPTHGPVVLATNCDTFDSSLQVVAATDRHTYFILLEHGEKKDEARLLRSLAIRSGFTILPAEKSSR